MLTNIKNKILQKEMLKLLPSFIRDCSSEIFSLFWEEILFVILDLLEITVLDIVEQVFVVLAYSMKYLFKEI